MLRGVSERGCKLVQGRGVFDASLPGRFGNMATTTWPQVAALGLEA